MRKLKKKGMLEDCPHSRLSKSQKKQRQGRASVYQELQLEWWLPCQNVQPVFCRKPLWVVEKEGGTYFYTTLKQL